MSYNVNKMYIIEIQPGVKAKFNTSILIPIYQLVNFWINRIKKDLLVLKKSQITIKLLLRRTRERKAVYHYQVQYPSLSQNYIL